MTLFTREESSWSLFSVGWGAGKPPWGDLGEVGASCAMLLGSTSRKNPFHLFSPPLSFTLFLFYFCRCFFLHLFECHTTRKWGGLCHE